jgi:scyllo-inositol 2-dehydrogenase (NADP+)
MINVGLIGFGLGGRVFHAPMISAVEGLRLAAIVQRSKSNVGELYPETRIVRSVEEILEVPEIDLVTVTTPNRTHFEIAKKCMEAGKHVVVDKPFAATLAEARELAGLARRRGTILSVYQNRRWDSDFLTVQKIVRDGVLGRIVIFEAHFDRFRPEVRTGSWKENAEPGTGILFDLGPHLIDQALVLFGKPDEIIADVRRERDGSAVDDAFDVIFFYPKMRAILRSTMLATAAGPRFVVNGDRAKFVKYGLDPQEEALIAGNNPGEEGWGREDESIAGTLTSASGEVTKIQSLVGNYRKYYENVRDAILGKTPLVVTPEQGIDVMVALELAVQSSQEGRRVAWPSARDLKPQVNRPKEGR